MREPALCDVMRMRKQSHMYMIARGGAQGAGACGGAQGAGASMRQQAGPDQKKLRGNEMAYSLKTLSQRKQTCDCDSHVHASLGPKAEGSCACTDRCRDNRKLLLGYVDLRLQLPGIDPNGGCVTARVLPQRPVLCFLCRTYCASEWSQLVLPTIALHS